MGNKNHDNKGRFATSTGEKLQIGASAALGAYFGYRAHALVPLIRMKRATKSKKYARSIAASYLRGPSQRSTRATIVGYAAKARKDLYRKQGYTAPTSNEELAQAAHRKIMEEGATRGDDPADTAKHAKFFANKIRGRFKTKGKPVDEVFGEGTRAVRDSIRQSTEKVVGAAPFIAAGRPISRGTKSAFIAGGIAANLPSTLYAIKKERQREETKRQKRLARKQAKLQKFNTNHDPEGRFSGGASMSQGSGKAPITHTQTRGEKWYRMGAKDPNDQERLARRHAAADYHARAFEALHDPENPEHRIKLAELKDKAAGLHDQLAAASPSEKDTERTFVQHIPKRGKTKHTKLMAKLVKHIHDSTESAIKNAKDRGLIPEGTNSKVVNRAYHHGALIAMHRSGVGKYDFNMSPEDKVHMRPLKQFIMYTHRRLFDEFHAQNKGAFKVYHEQFGQPFADKRKGPDGTERKRFSPQHEMVKFDNGELQKYLPELDRARSIASSYGPKLLQSVHKEMKSAISEGDKARSKLTKGIGSWIGGAIGGVAGGAATDGIGAEEGASIGSKIGGGVQGLLSGAKAAFQGSRASEGIGAAIRGVKAVASSAPVKAINRTYQKGAIALQHPFQVAGRTLGGKVGGFQGRLKGAKIGKQLDRGYEVASTAAVGAGAYHALKSKQNQRTM